MAKAKKLPSGSWRTLIYDYTDDKGKNHYKSFTADTKKESEYLATEYIVNKKDCDKDKGNCSVGQIILEYIDSKRQHYLRQQLVDMNVLTEIITMQF